MNFRGCIFALACGLTWNARAFAQPVAIGPPLPPSYFLQHAAPWPEGLRPPGKLEKENTFQSDNLFSAEVDCSATLEETFRHFESYFTQQGWKKGFVNRHKEQNYRYYMDYRLGNLYGSVQAWSRRDNVQGVFIQQRDESQGSDLEGDPLAAEVVAAMRERYEDARTYRDEGTVRLYPIYVRNKWDIEREIPFVTTFRRGDTLRYEVACEQTGRYVVRQKEGEVRQYWSRSNDDAEKESLHQALWDIYMGTYRQNNLIPFFLGESGSIRFPSCWDYRLVGFEEVNGEPCVVIEGDNEECLPMRMWISEREAALMKQENIEAGPEFHQRVVVTYYPVLDGPMSEDDLAYRKDGVLPYEEPSMFENAYDRTVGFLDDVWEGKVRVFGF